MLQLRVRGSYFTRNENVEGKRRNKDRRRTDGGYGKIFGSCARGFEDTGTRGGFSLMSWDDGRLSAPRIAEHNDLNIVNNHLINISVNPKVHESCELVPEVRDDKVRTEVIDNIDNVKKASNDFNLEVRGSLRPNRHKEL